MTFFALVRLLFFLRESLFALGGILHGVAKNFFCLGRKFLCIKNNFIFEVGVGDGRFEGGLGCLCVSATLALHRHSLTSRVAIAAVTRQIVVCSYTSSI